MLLVYLTIHDLGLTLLNLILSLSLATHAIFKMQGSLILLANLALPIFSLFDSVLGPV